MLLVEPVAEGVVELDDGRRLGYARWGEGRHPVIFSFHGGPGSRYMAAGAEHADALSLQVISLERPGFGLSDPAPDRRITTWPADVVTVADRLGIDRFAVMGVSAGGPYALACAAVVPERLTRVGVVSGALSPEFYERDRVVELVARDPAEAQRVVRENFVEISRDVEASLEKMARGAGPDGDI
jgi:pimeloyl-ACP methyl ester carboxylesterase